MTILVHITMELSPSDLGVIEASLGNLTDEAIIAFVEGRLDKLEIGECQVEDIEEFEEEEAPKTCTKHGAALLKFLRKRSNTQDTFMPEVHLIAKSLAKEPQKWRPSNNDYIRWEDEAPLTGTVIGFYEGYPCYLSVHPDLSCKRVPLTKAESKYLKECIDTTKQKEKLSHQENTRHRIRQFLGLDNGNKTHE